MALQGDLSSFALPDVLRLLAGTAKSGCLEVAASTATGEVWFHEGGLVGGAISTAPHAMRPAEVIFELLRLPEGSFVFDDTEGVDEADTTSVEEALDEAEALVAEWVEVEAVVPSMDAWITFAPALATDTVVVTAGQWRTLAAIGNGGSVNDLADVLELTDLAASREVKALVDAGMALVHLDQPAEVPAPSQAVLAEPEVSAEPESPAELEDAFEALHADDRTVVMETADDALLPEPLPGVGVSYEGDAVVAGAVDGRGFDAVDHESPYDHLPPVGYEAPIAELSTYAQVAPAADPAFESPFDPAPAAAPVATVPEVEDVMDEEPGGYRFGDDIPRHDFHGQAMAAAMPASAADQPAEAYDPLASTFGEAPVDDDRGSLLKFLSTVQP